MGVGGAPCKCIESLLLRDDAATISVYIADCASRKSRRPTTGKSQARVCCMYLSASGGRYGTERCADSRKA